MTKAEIERFIAEDEERSAEYAEKVCECDWCGESQYEGDEIIVMRTTDDEENVRICTRCLRRRGGIHFMEELLDVLGVRNYAGEAREAEAVADAWAAEGGR